MELADNIERVRERIAQACGRTGRDPTAVTLVAVSKTFPAQAVVEACHLGLRQFGENRVQEAARKIPEVKSLLSSAAPDSRPSISDVRWHLVGHLQSRKVRDAASLFDMIHSVDSLRLAEKISVACVEAGRIMPVLLECNVSGEASKFGFPLAGPGGKEQLMAAVRSILLLPGLHIDGLMTVAPLASDPESVRPIFRALHGMRDELAARFPEASWQHLSMGMTDDLDVAVEEGATIVRVGRALFGERQEG